MKRIALASIPLLLMLALVVAGCGKPVGGSTGGGNTGPADTIGMDSQDFTLGSGPQTALTVKAGTPVHFDNTFGGGGGYHIICVGKQPSCDPSGDGPAELYGKGFTFNNGMKKDFTFTKPGTYTIICTVHSNMTLTLTVQ